jgi:ribosomal-protein-alanine N-acetyltransferase
MRQKHIDAVHAVETASFSIPWPRSSFESELKNGVAIYFVAIDDKTGDVVGYAGMWSVVTEGHITNIAVKPERRREGVGAALLRECLKTAREKDMIGVTLEVRVGNSAATRLYANHGFKVEGIRKNYYYDTKEDAFIMWKTMGAPEQI